jgi:hypothetical protein
MGGPSDWVLGVGLSTPRRKNNILKKSHKETYTQTDFLIESNSSGQENRD